MTTNSVYSVNFIIQAYKIFVYKNIQNLHHDTMDNGYELIILLLSYILHYSAFIPCSFAWPTKNLENLAQVSSHHDTMIMRQD